MSEAVKCERCGEPMPPGEEMFKFHGFSGPCPKEKSEAVQSAERFIAAIETWAKATAELVPQLKAQPQGKLTPEEEAICKPKIEAALVRFGLACMALSEVSP